MFAAAAASPLVRLHLWRQPAAASAFSSASVERSLERRWEGPRAALSWARVADALQLHAAPAGSVLEAALVASDSSAAADPAQWRPLAGQADYDHLMHTLTGSRKVMLRSVVPAAAPAASPAAAKPARAMTSREAMESRRFRGNWAAESARTGVGRVDPAKLPPVKTAREEEEKSEQADDDDWEHVESLGASSRSAPTSASSGVPQTFPAALAATLVAPPASLALPDRVQFTLNGTAVTVPSSLDPTRTLASFLREDLGLTGTKIGCGEGGCGACMVFITPAGQVAGSNVNACMHLVSAINGADVLTVEGLGTIDKPHPIQQSIADNAATQCGYCTPGFAMSMYGLLATEASPTVAQVEDRFDSNICRCTGYRPIFAAMRKVLPAGAEESAQKHACESKENAGECKSSCSSPSPSPVDGLHKVRLHPCGKGSGSSCSSGAKAGCHAVGLKCGDVEDLLKFDRTNPRHLIPVSSAACKSSSAPRSTPAAMTWSSSPGQLFLSPSTLPDVHAVLEYYSSLPTPVAVKLTAGNTGLGVGKYFAPSRFIPAPAVVLSLANVAELTAVQLTPSALVVGAGVSISGLIAALESAIASLPAFQSTTFAPLVSHLLRVASQSLRSSATWAGNLMLAHAFPAFPSDLLTIFSAARASILVAGKGGQTRSVVVAELQSSSSAFQPDELVVSLSLPLSTAAVGFGTFKARPRNQLAHASVNCGLMFVYSTSSSEISPSGAPPATTVADATIAFGGLSPASGVFLASKTEGALRGQVLSSTTLANVLATLQAEIAAIPPPPASAGHGLRSDPAFLASAALGMVYSFFLAEMVRLGVALPPRLVSATVPFVRPISAGAEVYALVPALLPVGAAIPKIEGLSQATGQARYTNDEPMGNRGVHGAIVTSTVAAGTILSIDASAALAMDGVVRFVSAKDVANVSKGGGHNDCGSFPGDEEVFASTSVATWGQCVGMILAETQERANEAARAVVVTYGPPLAPPMLTLDSAIAAKAWFPDHAGGGQINTPPLVCGDVAAGFAASFKVVSGSTFSGGQAHFSLETQSSYATPGESGGVTMYCASQGTSAIRQVVSNALGVSANKVVVKTHHVGGAYGSKLTRSWPLACATAIAAVVSGRPVKSQVERGADMEAYGKRPQVRTDYRVGFGANGKILALEMTAYQQGGHSYEANLGCMQMFLYWAANTYYLPNFSATGFVARTNTPSNTSMRGPGVLATIGNTELIMERVAFELGMTPDAVREANFLTEGQTTPYMEPVTNLKIQQCWTTLHKQVNLPAVQQSVATFNAANRWRKRGVHCSSVLYSIADSGPYNQTSMMLNVAMEDGSLQVICSGVEMGQGLNTKVLQTLCYELSLLGSGVTVDMSMIQIGSNSTDAVSNGAFTGGSSGSETCCAVAILAATELRSRLAPILVANPSINTWWGLIQAAQNAMVNLQVSSQYFIASPPADEQNTYFVSCVACSQVEINCLTGEVQVLAVDIVYDNGDSLNPAVDIGQIEGGFVLGLGHMLTEEVIHSDTTGELLSKGSWDYHVPSSHDIPLSFNVTLLAQAPNPLGVLSSKAVAEPPVSLAVSALLAVRDCITAARADAGVTGEWFDLPAPATTERIQLACMVSPQTLVL